MSEPVVSIANLDNKEAAEAIIDCAGEFFSSITLEDIPNILKDILDNLKSVGKEVIDKIKDFIVNDFWGLVIDTKDIIKSLLNQHLDKALNCASRALDKLEKVLDVLSYIPQLSLAVGVILIVVYICKLDFAAVAAAAMCILSPLKIITKIFPKSKIIIKKLTDFLVEFGRRFKDQAKLSLKTLVKKSKAGDNRQLLSITSKSGKGTQGVQGTTGGANGGANGGTNGGANAPILGEKFDSNRYYGINTNNTQNKGLNGFVEESLSQSNQTENSMLGQQMVNQEIYRWLVWNQSK